jgi:hypothetical protein
MPPKILMHGWNKGPGIWFPHRAGLHNRYCRAAAGPMHMGDMLVARLRLRMR